MLVAYNKPNVLHMYTHDDADVGQTGSKAFMLKPGINEVAKEAWAKLCQLPKVKRLISADVITVEDQKAESSDTKSARATLQPVKAIDIVRKTYDLKLLKSWRECETRPKVASAIGVQIKNIYERTDKPISED